MKIDREINGEIKQIELTDKELNYAYLEQQHIYDRQDIEDALENYLYEAEDKEFYKKYGISFNIVYQNDELIDELAYEIRKNQDKYDMSNETAQEEAFKDILEKYREKYSMRAVPNDKIMVAVLDDGYYAEKGEYPAGFDSDLPYSSFVFDTPEEFIKNWNELDDGRWYWVFDKGELICSGAIDPNDIEIFEEHWDRSFEDNSPALPESIRITASELALDTDDIYRDEDEMSDILSDYLSDTYGFCHYGFDFEVHYNEFNEPSETIVSNVKWDVDKDNESEKSADKSLNDIVADATQRSAETNTDKTVNTELTKE